MKIASLQQKINYLEKKVDDLEHTLEEKEEYFQYAEKPQDENNSSNTSAISVESTGKENEIHIERQEMEEFNGESYFAHQDVGDYYLNDKLDEYQNGMCQGKTLRKLACDVIELNFQLQARDKIISNQQETIDLLQNSLQMEQCEIKSLKLEKENADKETQTLQEKVTQLELNLVNMREETQEMRGRLNATCKTIFSELKGRFEEYCDQTVWQIESAEVLKESNVQLSEYVQQLHQQHSHFQDEISEYKNVVQQREVRADMMDSWHV